MSRRRYLRAFVEMDLTDSLPPPPVPAEVDVSDMEYMPLMVGRLLGSEWRERAVLHPRAAVGAVLLWCEAWRRVPAGSLPNNIDELVRLASLPTDRRDVARLLPIAMAGFVLCSDGRLYHPVVAARALDTWQKRQRRAARNERNRDANGVDRHGNAMDTPGYNHGNAGDTAAKNNELDRSKTPHVAAKCKDKTVSTSVDTVSVGAQAARPTHRATTLFTIDGGEASRTAAREKAKGSRIRADWSPSADDVAFAEKLGLNASDIADNFRDFYLAAAGPNAAKRDWPATWRRWCRRDAEELAHWPRYGSRARPLTPSQQGQAEAARLLRELDEAEAKAAAQSEPRTVKATVL